MATEDETRTRDGGTRRAVGELRRSALRAIKEGFAGAAAASIRPGLVLEKRIGEGGAAAVHAALDHALQRRVAVKVLRHGGVLAEAQEARFVDEARLTAGLEHPNIVPIHEIGTAPDGTLYFSMKLVTGNPLSDLLRDIAPRGRSERELHELIKVLVKACDALAFAHANGVVHRDLKPENILVGDFGEVYVMDWGIALRVAPPGGGAPESRFPVGESLDVLGTIVGTPEYMAPEQARGDTLETDPRTDVFGLGAILYQILTGRPPYQEDDVYDTILAASQRRVTPPASLCPEVPLPPVLCAIAMRAMSHDRGDRHASVGELQEDLERFLRGSAWFPDRTYEAGEWIVREGEQADAAFVIASGTCEVVREEATGLVVLLTMQPGQVFGEAAIFANAPRSASVRAASAVRVTVVARDALLGELGAGSWMMPFVRTLAERFAEQSREASALRDRATVAEVAAHAIRSVAERSGTGGALEAALRDVLADVTAATGLTEDRVRALLTDSPTVSIAGRVVRICPSGRCA